EAVDQLVRGDYGEVTPDTEAAAAGEIRGDVDGRVAVRPAALRVHVGGAAVASERGLRLVVIDEVLLRRVVEAGREQVVAQLLDARSRRLVVVGRRMRQTHVGDVERARPRAREAGEVEA